MGTNGLVSVAIDRSNYLLNGPHYYITALKIGAMIFSGINLLKFVYTKRSYATTDLALTLNSAHLQ